jgi:chromosome segregation ATPase
MAMRDADKDRRKNLPTKNSYSWGQESMSFSEYRKSLIDERNLWQQRAKENEEAVSQLTQAQEEIGAYQNEINELKERAAQSHQKYQNEQKIYQQTLSLYDKEKAKAVELISQRNQLQQQVKKSKEETSKLVLFQGNLEKSYGIKVKEFENKITENYLLYINEQEKFQKTKSQLVQVQQNIQTYEIEVNELKESVAHSHQLYLGEQQNYQQTLSLYNEEKAKATELLVKYEEVSSERDNYVILYNEAKAELKFERRSKASIKGWETRRKAENERLKKEISDMVVLLRESLTSKDEAINNLYIVAERMDRIQSLVDLVDEETTSNPVGIIQKFKRIWLAIKEILSE